MENRTSNESRTVLVKNKDCPFILQFYSFLFYAIIMKTVDKSL